MKPSSHVTTPKFGPKFSPSWQAINMHTIWIEIWAKWFWNQFCRSAIDTMLNLYRIEFEINSMSVCVNNGLRNARKRAHGLQISNLRARK